MYSLTIAIYYMLYTIHTRTHTHTHTHQPKPDNLMPLYIDVNSGHFTSAHVSLGAMGDSAFEYLIKVLYTIYVVPSHTV